MLGLGDGGGGEEGGAGGVLFHLECNIIDELELLRGWLER